MHLTILFTTNYNAMLDGSKTVAIRKQDADVGFPKTLFPHFYQEFYQTDSDKIPAAVRCAPCWTPAHAFLIYSTINHPPTDDYFSQPGPLPATAATAGV